MALDRDKYRRLFIDEAREGLAQIGNELVELEKAGKADAPPSDPTAQKNRFDAVFRHAHSLKGMGAAMGFVRFANLAHRLEDLADLGRQGRALPPAAYDLLLEGVDVLEGAVEAVVAGADDPDTADLVSKVGRLVDELRAASLPPRPAAPTATPTTTTTTTTTTSTTTTTATTATEGSTFEVRVRFGDDVSLPQVRAFVVHRTLAALPGYLETQPSPEALRQKELPEFVANRVLTVRFNAGADKDAIVAAAQGGQGVKDVEVKAVADKRDVDDKGDRAKDDKREEDRTVRVRTQLLDELIDSVGEILLARSRLKTLAARLEEAELDEIVDEVDRLTRALHVQVVAARMTPLSFMAERLPRVVRDLARQQQKAVDFTMVGMDIELDRAILDELQAPLIHMLRNAVDHGHEGEAGRSAVGKPSTMKLTLRAQRDRDRVLLVLDDDGKGIDPVRVKQRALDKGLIDRARARPPGEGGLADDAALELICLPGFSTAEQVTETSGRGVGMDVVKASLEKIGGALRIASKVGQGSTLTLELPLTVAIIQVLVVDVDGADAGYVIPVARVERALAVDDAAVSVAGERAFLQVGPRLLPFFNLAALLGFSNEHIPPPSGTAVVVGNAAFRVARIVGQEEVVAKPLGPPLSNLGYVAGGATLADGRAAFLLEPQRLVTA
jgi:two-component system chemotaxis sensor kinase CheA